VDLKISFSFSFPFNLQSSINLYRRFSVFSLYSVLHSECINFDLMRFSGNAVTDKCTIRCIEWCCQCCFSCCVDDIAVETAAKTNQWHPHT